MKAGKSYRTDLIHDLKQPSEASAYLNTALEEADKQGFLLALRNVVEANGGMSAFAAKTGINRVSLYKILSSKGNPEFASLMTIFNALGIQLRLKPRNKSAA